MSPWENETSVTQVPARDALTESVKEFQNSLQGCWGGELVLGWHAIDTNLFQVSFSDSCFFFLYLLESLCDGLDVSSPIYVLKF